MPLRRARTRAPELTPEQERLVWRIAALALDYPDAELLGLVPQLSDAAQTIPGRAGLALRAFLDDVAGRDPIALAADYVETFDLRRRSCLHLTYYAYGDTRKRGMALLRFKHAYRTAGVELGDHELPDHLAVVLEFAATADPEGGRRLLMDHLPVIELLRLSLHDNGSGYASVLDAISVTLPDLDEVDRGRVAALAAEGPPEEEVGLDPFAMDPSLLPDIGGRK
ncbi:nitrate reductase molybdenum cofactor assembly chaperone [Corynebacteriales bacterium D3-21]|uniref:Nitrate reductase molybdenum cofactor assembly chaperone n=1 Tax=Speluncibacter jeojiensis TaxID=2710754 RepID=A0A9X4RFH9_9ACTN|nr:nitrate reductase molybdenum cofactor assembly chaperone [Rhodococcus sp. D2-41]MDG3013011.1 nitrate reductase molybdenum cofactor assembly chaperone [Corynebacteriales bacterium D3-21]